MDNVIELLQQDIQDARKRREQIEGLIELQDVNSNKYASLVNESFHVLGSIHGLEIAIKRIEIAAEESK